MTSLGHYQLDGELGRGGMGVVFRATDTRLGRPVALKVVQRAAADAAGLTMTELRARLRQEAQLASRIIHPHVVTVFAYDEVGDDALIAMELVEGRTLAELLSAGHRWTVRDAGLLLAQVAEGVAAAHALGIVHRDIKPGNVMLTADGRCKVLDFGIAKAAATEAAPAMSRTTFGTVQYMAPEQVLGKPVTPATDVWALGVVAYEMITGRVAFGDGAPIAIGMRVAGEAPPYLQDPALAAQVFGVLTEPVQRALQKSAAARPTDAAALRAQLLTSLGIAPDPLQTYAPMPREKTREFATTVEQAVSGNAALADSNSSSATAPRGVRTTDASLSTARSQTRSSARRIAIALGIVVALGGTAAAVTVARGSRQSVASTTPGDLPLAETVVVTPEVSASAETKATREPSAQIVAPGVSSARTPSVPDRGTSARTTGAMDTTKKDTLVRTTQVASRPDTIRALAAGPSLTVVSPVSSLPAPLPVPAPTSAAAQRAEPPLNGALVAVRNAIRALAAGPSLTAVPSVSSPPAPLPVPAPTSSAAQKAEPPPNGALVALHSLTELPDDGEVRKAAITVADGLFRGENRSPELQKFLSDGDEHKIDKVGESQRHGIGGAHELVEFELQLSKRNGNGAPVRRKAVVSFDITKRDGRVVLTNVVVGPLAPR
jgi:serine/threonine-protein kinase